jgi:hypothetical protein
MSNKQKSNAGGHSTHDKVLILHEALVHLQTSPYESISIHNKRSSENKFFVLMKTFNDDQILDIDQGHS